MNQVNLNKALKQLQSKQNNEGGNSIESLGLQSKDINCSLLIKFSIEKQLEHENSFTNNGSTAPTMTSEKLKVQVNDEIIAQKQAS